MVAELRRSGLDDEASLLHESDRHDEEPDAGLERRHLARVHLKLQLQMFTNRVEQCEHMHLVEPSRRVLAKDWSRRDSLHLAASQVVEQLAEHILVRRVCDPIQIAIDALRTFRGVLRVRRPTSLRDAVLHFLESSKDLVVLLEDGGRLGVLPFRNERLRSRDALNKRRQEHEPVANALARLARNAILGIERLRQRRNEAQPGIEQVGTVGNLRTLPNALSRDEKLSFELARPLEGE